MNLLQILLQALKTRILPLVTKIKLFLSPNYLKSRLTEFIRTFFTKVLNIKPKDKNDYYPIGNWLVSKKLAFAMVLIVGVLSFVYIVFSWNALFPGKSNERIKTYSYNNVLLKFAKGNVRIKGKSGYLAYEGEVSKGSCNGVGQLRNPAGFIVYQGNFKQSMYEGEGTQYYDDGSLHYKGAFHENLYSGSGTLYRTNGSVEYEGGFSYNKKEGQGILYDMGHNEIYNGMFTEDDIKYSDLLGKSATEVAGAYKGERTLYNTKDEHIRFMPDIDAMTVEFVDEDSIDTEGEVETVYVLKDSFNTAKGPVKSFKDIADILGQPIYVGSSYGTCSELLAITKISEENERVYFSGNPKIDTTAVYNEYIDVTDYENQYEVYLHTYRQDGLVYTFVTEPGLETFYFYFVQNEELADVG